MSKNSSRAAANNRANQMNPAYWSARGTPAPSPASTPVEATTPGPVTPPSDSPGQSDGKR